MREQTPHPQSPQRLSSTRSQGAFLGMDGNPRSDVVQSISLQAASSPFQDPVKQLQSPTDTYSISFVTVYFLLGTVRHPHDQHAQKAATIQIIKHPSYPFITFPHRKERHTNICSSLPPAPRPPGHVAPPGAACSAARSSWALPSSPPRLVARENSPRRFAGRKTDERRTVLRRFGRRRTLLDGNKTRKRFGLPVSSCCHENFMVA